MDRRCALIALIVFSSISLVGAVTFSAQDESAQLADELLPFLNCLAGKYEKFNLSGAIAGKFGGRVHRLDMRLVKYSKEAFDLDLTHEDYAVQIRRRAQTTAMALPLHNVVFLGQGETDYADHLAPDGISRRLCGGNSLFSVYVPMAMRGDPQSVARLAVGFLKIRYDAANGSWNCGDDVVVKFSNENSTMEVAAPDVRARLSLSSDVGEPVAADDWPGMRTNPLERRELERQLTRGVRRALEIAAPSVILRTPFQKTKKVENGELRWIGGQRVALLQGSPEQIGRAHAELLKYEAVSCVDSVLYTFGTAQTIRTGKWFRHELDQAYARLSPHIPEHHKVETRAMAASLGLDGKTIESLNVFPELFHCSGFAVFGSATKGGKLYHGRVLDYMTVIGLQDAATTFIVAPQGKIPFVSVGYAGFTGCVSGMNSQCISLGEMGGRGEGEWDGVPMATLMRRALEECSTLNQVKDLWQNNPRTCEYYYVFADGKSNDAVGCAATPRSIEFVLPGQSHERLGPGIKDTVILSAGSRLEKLRERVSQRYGSIDANVGQWLMSHPVAMNSNLHNVLFVPQDGVLYVANADYKHPAYERPYVQLNLNELLNTLPSASGTPAATTARK